MTLWYSSALDCQDTLATEKTLSGGSTQALLLPVLSDVSHTKTYPSLISSPLTVNSPIGRHPPAVIQEVFPSVSVKQFPESQEVTVEVEVPQP